MSIRVVAAASTAIALVLALGGGTAHADPDPHIPDPGHDYCPGGGIGAKFFSGYCDGAPYPDGSYWHVVGLGPWDLSTTCVVVNGQVPQPAPPGGCGGSV